LFGHGQDEIGGDIRAYFRMELAHMQPDLVDQGILITGAKGDTAFATDDEKLGWGTRSQLV
jgi:hypothetical protein